MLDHDFAETMSYWATTFGVVAVIIAGAWAYWRYRADRRVQEWDRARQAYVSFIDIAIANPEFYPGSWSRNVKNNPIAKNKYIWFIARFAWASEEMLLTMPPEERAFWHISIQGIVREHLDFFCSPEGQAELACYHPALIEVISPAIEAACAQGLQ